MFCIGKNEACCIWDDWRVRRKCRSIFRRVHRCPASRKTKPAAFEIAACTPEMQEHFPAGTSMSGIPKSEAAFFN